MQLTVFQWLLFAPLGLLVCNLSLLHKLMRNLLNRLQMLKLSLLFGWAPLSNRQGWFTIRPRFWCSSLAGRPGPRCLPHTMVCLLRPALVGRQWLIKLLLRLDRNTSRAFRLTVLENCGTALDRVKGLLAFLIWEDDLSRSDWLLALTLAQFLTRVLGKFRANFDVGSFL